MSGAALDRHEDAYTDTTLGKYAQAVVDAFARPDGSGWGVAIDNLRAHLRRMPAPTEGLSTLTVPDSIKMLRETLSVAQNRIGNSPLDKGQRREHMDRLGRLIDDCERQRPTGPDCKHGDRHTPTCGCDLSRLVAKMRSVDIPALTEAIRVHFSQGRHGYSNAACAGAIAAEYGLLATGAEALP